MKINWDLIARLLPTVFQVTGAGIVYVLHSTGADKHKTVAGELAQSLDQAARVVQAVHRELMNGFTRPGRAADAPGGGP